MWVLFAFGSALFAGMTAILSKRGIKNTDSNVATAIRTIVVLIFSWLMVFIVGSQDTIGCINRNTLIFLVLSGLATGASWLCYFKALQFGDVNKVTPIDKSSTILTMIMAILFLGESITLIKVVAILLIGVGTYLMIQKKKGVNSVEVRSNRWVIYAVLAAIFASLTSILGKVGIEGVESNLGTAIVHCCTIMDD
jgi:transporter family protein